jgi:hypothetical protein
MFRLKAPQYQISLLADGFVVTRDGNAIEQLKWKDVREVIAYKQDLVTVDRVCLELWSMVGEVAAINEDLPGFVIFREEMERALVGIDVDWWAKVVHTPFAENQTVIFRRSLA